MTMTNPYAPPRAAVADVAVAGGPAELAGRGARLGATFLDGLIFMLMVYLPLLLAGGLSGAVGSSGEAETVAAVFLGLTAVGLIAWLWLTFKFVAANGQTIAKKLLNIKVVRRDGSAATVSRIFWLRNIVNGALSIIPLYGLIDAIFIFGESRQCLHDKIADTIVVQA